MVTGNEIIIQNDELIWSFNWSVKFFFSDFMSKRVIVVSELTNRRFMF